jgi:hypothetical protein
MKSGRLKVTLVGSDNLIKLETSDEGLRKSLTFRNNKVSIKQLIAALQDLESQLSGQSSQHTCETAGTEEVQCETEAEEASGAA